MNFDLMKYSCYYFLRARQKKDNFSFACRNGLLLTNLFIYLLFTWESWNKQNLHFVSNGYLNNCRKTYLVVIHKHYFKNYISLTVENSICNCYLLQSTWWNTEKMHLARLFCCIIYKYEFLCDLLSTEY